jgi:transposase
VSTEAAALPEDPTLLKAMIAALLAENAKMSATIRAHDQLIQTLRLRIAKLKKQVFGKSSERIEREIAQLELALEDLLIATAESASTLVEVEADAAETHETHEPETQDDAPEHKPRRRPRISSTTPRERREIDPGSSCPSCGGALRFLDEDSSEMLDLVMAQLKIVQIARLKKSCRCCEKIVQPPAPTRPIPGSMASAGLLAYILVAKFDDHIPLYRLAEILARMGAEIPDTTLVDWCGRAMKALKPLSDLIEDRVMASDLLHADDTPIRVLDRSLRQEGLGKGVKKGRIWAYVRDQRPWAGPAPPGAVYRFAPDWKEEHVRSHLQRTKGILQADGYKGYAKLYAPGPDGAVRFQEAACWAHWRRDFHDVWTTTKSEIAREALDRIGALYDIELQITGQTADVRCSVRQTHSRSKVEAFRVWAEQQLTRIPGKSDLAKAFRYGLSRWSSFCLFLQDGRVSIDNNAAERALRPIGIGRKNWLFAGADSGAETIARAMTVIETAKMNGLNPQAYLEDVLDRIHDHKINKLDELLPWNWRPRGFDETAKAA